MTTINVTDDQIEQIIVDDLKQSLEMNIGSLEKDEDGSYLEPDYELVEAIKTVLKYYMPLRDVSEYLDAIEVKEKLIKLQLEKR